MYKLARRGVAVRKAARPVHIAALEICNIRLPEIEFNVTCSAGTYVRTLAAEIGDTLGCGAHLSSLRRTASSGFSIHQALTPDQLDERRRSETLPECLIPMAQALTGMPAVTAGRDLAGKIAHGAPLDWDDIPRPAADDAPYIKIVDRSSTLLAVVERRDDRQSYKYCCVFQ